MKMIRVFLLGLVVAFGALAEQKLPNILWITSEDTVSYTHLTLPTNREV